MRTEEEFEKIADDKNRRKRGRFYLGVLREIVRKNRQKRKLKFDGLSTFDPIDYSDSSNN